MGTKLRSAKLTAADYYDKVYGGWMGKNIGGTLGAPVEGKKELLELTYYPELPDGPLENDDLDLQLVWLHALEQYGPRLTAQELGQEWLEHIFFPFDEYGFALTNLRKGLIPPLTGSFNNPFNNAMGSPIRSEIWAMAAPGRPEIAAYYAYQDAIVDHAGGEGVYGEVFFAAIESAAFVEEDRDRLIQIGLNYIPEHCRTAKAVRSLLKWHQEGKTWTEARELILEHHGHQNFTDAPQNIAFTILGWLYGTDFEDAILKAVNCGYDTDCTAATLASILGILGGKDCFPKRWVEPIGDRVVVSPPIKGFPAPKDLDELTKRTMKMGEEVAAYWNESSRSAQEDTVQRIHRMLSAPTHVNQFNLPKGSREGLQLTIDYGAEGPAIGGEETKTLFFKLENNTQEAWEGHLTLTVPEDWQETPEKPFHIEPGDLLEWSVEVKAGRVQRSSHPLALHVHRYHDDSPWHTETVPFVLTGAFEWTFTSPEGSRKHAAVPGNALPFSKELETTLPGVYKAETILDNPKERNVRLIVATIHPVKVKLDGEVILENSDPAPFMPAYHRAPRNRVVDLQLEAKQYALEIEVVKDNEPLEVYVMPVSSARTKQPGSRYYYIDILFTSVADRGN